MSAEAWFAVLAILYLGAMTTRLIAARCNKRTNYDPDVNL